MVRRAWVTMVATAATVLLLVVAASSGPTRLWTTPASNGAPSSGRPGSGSTTVTTIAPRDGSVRDVDWPDWVGTALQIAGVGLITLVVLAFLAADRLGTRVPRRWRIAVRRRRGRFSALPPVADTRLVVDVEATRAALVGGSASNAIIACWIQLEHAAAASGLGRLAAETSSEYVQRVVAGASVDPVPISELAALYREARFSRHELDDDHRTRAAAALHRVIVALEVAEGVVA